MGPSSQEGEGIVIVDSSFLVALVHESDYFHREAVRTLPKGDRLLIPGEVWVEFVDVMARLLPPEKLEEIGGSVLKGPFQVQPLMQAEGLMKLAARGKHLQSASRRRGRKPLSIFDLVVCGTAERFREGVLTFDEGIIEVVRAKLFPGARIA